MAVIARMQVTWQGVGVTGPAISTFYFGGPSMTGAPAAVVTFFNAIKNFFTADVSWTIPNTGDSLDPSDGSLQPGWSVSGGATVTGGASGHNWAQGVGTRLVWDTTDIFARRRVKGATFLTSMNAIEFQTDGTLQTTTVNAIAAAGVALVAARPDMVVWSRPKFVKPATVPPTLLRPGAAHIVSSAHVPDKVSWLRSRRT